MAGGTAWKAGPAFLAASATDVAGVNPAANTYRKIYHIHVANTNASARTLNLYIGLTNGSANGTELIEGYSIAGNATYDIYFPSGLRIVAADFLSGFSGTDATSLVITVTGESFVL
jgi:hypothetical protein